jgi:hypothetical protein
LSLKTYGNWARHHKDSGSVAGEDRSRKADAGYKKDGTEGRVCSQLNSLTQRKDREDGRVNEKLGHETQAWERKGTQKSSLLSSKFFRTLNNNGDSVDEARPP